MARQSRNSNAKPHNAQVSQLAGTNSLPSLPHITADLLDKLACSDVSVSELADVIKLDPALSLNVMRLAQDRSSQAVPDVANAARLVGRDTLANLVRWSSTLDVFDTYSFCSPGDLTEFWAHSMKCALLAEHLGRELEFHDPDGAFLAGQLHDIGKLLLLTYYPTKYKLRFSGSADGRQKKADPDDLVGDEHASMGAALVRRWRHHSLLADAVFYHHHPADAVARAFPLVKLVYAANLLAKADSPDKELLTRPEMGMLELSSTQLERAVDTAFSSFRKTAAGLNIDLPIAFKDASQAPPSHTDAHAAVTGHVRDTSLLATLSYGLLNAREANDVLHLVEQTLHGHFDIDRVVFFLIDRESDTLEAHGQCCSYVGELSVPLSNDSCSPVLALNKEHAVDCFVTSGNSKISIMDEQIVHFLGKEGVVCLPMVVDGAPVGTIALGINRADRAVLSGQQQLLDRLSKHAARALLNCQKQSALEVPQQQDRVESVITLTRKAVHEANNPLGIIKNYLSVLARRMAEQNIEHDEIRIIGEEIARIRNILAALVKSSKEVAVTMAPVDLNAMVDDLVRLMKQDLSEQNGIQIHSRLSSSLPMALTDKDVLKQAVLNLLKNSAEALTDGGNIHVETEFVPGDKENHVDNGNGRAKLTIRDDGPGIPESVRDQLFQPFVTSKASHEGLGLSIAQGLIQQLHGTISCDPAAESGTQFTIWLPVASS
jgi:signal transduction histidine kinase/HD-like signal output (HDOD) protein